MLPKFFYIYFIKRLKKVWRWEIERFWSFFKIIFFRSSYKNLIHWILKNFSMCVIAKENVPATTDRGIWHVCNVNRAWLKQASTAVWSRHQSPTVLTVFLGRGICILLDTLASNFKTSCHFFNLNFQLEEVIWKWMTVTGVLNTSSKF